MKRRWLSFLLAALFVILFMLPGAAEEAADDGELLFNGGFEELGADGLPEGWMTDAYFMTEGYTVWKADGDAHGGGHCASINNIVLNDARFMQMVEVEPSSMYCLSGWVRASDVSAEGRGANLSIEGVYSFTQAVRETKGDWRYVELYGETDVDQEYLVVYARLGGYSGESTGVACFDDLSLRRVDRLPDDVTADLWFPLSASYDDTDEDLFDDETGGAAAPAWPYLLAIGILYAAVLLVLGRYPARDRRVLAGQGLKEDRNALWIVLTSVGMCLAFALRCVLALYIQGYQVDIGCFSAWGGRMASVGPAGFYDANYFCDYPPAYMYVLGVNSAFAGMIRGASADAFAVGVFVNKLLPMLADLGIALMAGAAAKAASGDRGRACVWTLLTAFNPLLVLNSACWGQIDSVLALLLLAVAWTAYRRKWMAVMPLYMLAVLVKPQALMLGFLGLTAIVLAWVRHREDRKGMLIGAGIAAAVALVILIPCSIGQEPGWIIAKYGETLSSYPYATVNTANLYYLFDANWSPLNSTAAWGTAVVLAVTALAWGLWSMETARRGQRKAPFLEFGLMMAFTAFFTGCALTGASWAVMGCGAMALAFAVVLPLYVRGGKIEHLPLLGGVLFLLLYVLGVKMHERYLFPAIALLAMAYALRKDPRILLLLALTTFTVFLNTGIPLDNSIRLGSASGHLNSDTKDLAMVLSVLNLLSVPLALWVCTDACVLSRLPGEAPDLPIRRLSRSPADVRTFRADSGLHWKKLDTVLMLALTLVYSAAALWDLGSLKAPQTAWTSSGEREQVVLDLGESRTDFSMAYFCGVSYKDFTVAVSEDGEHWSDEYTAQMDQGQCYRWKYLMEVNGGNTYDQVQKLSGRYVRITSGQVNLNLKEVIFRETVWSETERVSWDGTPYTEQTSASGAQIPVTLVSASGAQPDSPLFSDPAALIDEQDTLEGEPGWYNSTYFDEIYHARTAYEHLHGQMPYETTHPPLGKLLMSCAVAVFGMTPFGWRFAGALAGILMLPVMYLLGKQLTKRTAPAFAAAFLMAVDCMHYTQTRIATIDSFPVLFILLAFFFMLRFMQSDLSAPGPLRRLMPDLALSGFFMGCAVASKWIGIYAGMGLAVLYFWTCIRHLLLARRAGEALAAGEAGERTEEMTFRRDNAFRRVVLLSVSCLVFFVAVPVIIYLLCYIPYFAYTRVDSVGGFLRLVIQSQQSMLGYHSTPGLGMDHPFYSPWYEWPVIARPMYYAMASFMPEGYSQSIFCFGNPAVWLPGLAGIACVLAVFTRRRRYLLEGSDFELHWRSTSWSVAPAFVLIGLLAQFLPWVLVPRGTYIYHYFASTPFLMLAVALCFHWLGKRFPRAARWALAGYLAVCLLTFAAFFPYASGAVTPVGWLDFMSRFLHLYHS